MHSPINFCTFALKFEVGEYSIGPNISRHDGYEDFPNLLYDITDEYAAHERQNFFRENEFTQKEIISMSLCKDLIMKYIELIFCKLVWLRVKIVSSKRPNFFSITDTFGILKTIILGFSMSVGVLILNILNKLHGLYLIIFGCVLTLIFYLPLKKYLKREMKSKRIIYNKEYMQSKLGMALVLICILSIFIMPILAVWISNILEGR